MNSFQAVVETIEDTVPLLDQKWNEVVMFPKKVKRLNLGFRQKIASLLKCTKYYSRFKSTLALDVGNLQTSVYQYQNIMKNLNKSDKKEKIIKTAEVIENMKLEKKEFKEIVSKMMQKMKERKKLGFKRIFTSKESFINNKLADNLNENKQTKNLKKNRNKNCKNIKIRTMSQRNKSEVDNGHKMDIIEVDNGQRIDKNESGDKYELGKKSFFKSKFNKTEEINKRLSPSYKLSTTVSNNENSKSALYPLLESAKSLDRLNRRSLFRGDNYHNNFKGLKIQRHKENTASSFKGKKRSKLWAYKSFETLI